MAATAQVDCAFFGFFTPEESRKLSVKRITNPNSFDILGNAVAGGLYDPAMGTLDYRNRCTTCSMMHKKCPGHLGHIELVAPVYNPVNFSELVSLVRIKCLFCHHFKVKAPKVYLYSIKLKLLDAGLINEVEELENLVWGQLSDDGDDEEDTKPKVDEDMIEKADQFVRHILKKRGWTALPSRLKLQPDSHVLEERSKLISTFMKHAIGLKKCENCGAFGPPIRSATGPKIFQQPLSAAHTSLNEALGFRIEDIFSSQGNVEEADGAENKRTSEKSKTKGAKTALFLTPSEVLKHLEYLWKEENRYVNLVYGSPRFVSSDKETKMVIKCDCRIFFITALLVVPNRFRPANSEGERTIENPQNVHLQRVLSLNAQLYAMSKSDDGNLDLNKGVSTWNSLQEAVVGYIDSQMLSAQQQRSLPTGIRQLLERKEGLFRKHLMGKRVNYGARSVISPDPFLQTCEIGVPLHFAQRLSYPEPVTAMNVESLRQAVINGPHKYPGANYVQESDGTLVPLEHRNTVQRISLSKSLLSLGPGEVSANGPVYNTKVGRHLKDGDILLVNRQPTLHRPSIMAHKAKVLKTDRVIRFHYVNCATYNADFDGDEINLHLPQNELARAEGYTIANTDNQYIVPSSGKPIRGLIQDHVVGGVLLSKRDVMLDRHHYMQLVYNACEGLSSQKPIEPMIPYLMKPVQRWSGKQVISTLLRHMTQGCPTFNLDSKSRVKGTAWDPLGKTSTEEDSIVIRNCDLLCGILDRSQFGASSFGLVHVIHELYDPTLAGELLTALGRLFTAYIQMHGFTMGIADCLLSHEADKNREKLLDNAYATGKAVVKEECHSSDGDDLSSQMEKFLRAGKHVASAKLDGKMRMALNPITTEITSSCLPSGQVKAFPDNGLALMTQAGAKGSVVNHSQIACLLGQQELEGKRVPRMINGKTLPCFGEYDVSARAGGFVGQRFLTGLHPPEYFFHCMAGREGLIDTAVKTSSSGYLQRCLVKHLEGILVNYDSTVRNENGGVLQFNYGDDGIDVTKSAFLFDKGLGIMAANYSPLLRKMNVADANEKLEHNKHVFKKMSKSIKKPGKYDPVLADFNPSSTLGAVSEKFHRKMEEFIESNPDRFVAEDDDDKNKISPAKYRALMRLKYMKSVAVPGESVGILAAQSVGEPSTQMTLNTFHLAGVAAVNVTLGIPRLREILMTASANIKTPAMILPLRASLHSSHARKIAAKIDRIMLADLVDTLSTEEFLDFEKDDTYRKYVISMVLKRKSEIKSVLGISMKQVERAISKIYVPQLMKAVGASQSKDPISQSQAPATEKHTESQQPEDNPAADVDSDSESDDDDDVALAADGDGHASRRVADRHSYANDDAGEDGNENIPALDENKEAISPTEPKEPMKGKVSGAVKQGSRVTFKDEERPSCEIELFIHSGSEKTLVMNLAEKQVSKTVVRAVRGISHCHVTELRMKDETDRPAVATEGVNFGMAFKYSKKFDVNHIESNDVASILHTYGVEAARNSIIKEVAGVFGVYGITVDPRHLSLIGDYMTHEGGFKPFSRHSIYTNSSPINRMSFETSTHFLAQSSLRGELEHVTSPSACLTFGRPSRVGTGIVNVIVPLKNEDGS